MSASKSKYFVATTNYPVCGSCTRPAFNPEIDSKLFFCGAITDPDTSVTSKTPLFIGGAVADFESKAFSRCPRRHDSNLDLSIKEELIVYGC